MYGLYGVRCVWTIRGKVCMDYTGQGVYGLYGVRCVWTIRGKVCMDYTG